jgi:hypothetical protein
MSALKYLVNIASCRYHFIEDILEPSALVRVIASAFREDILASSIAEPRQNTRNTLEAMELQMAVQFNLSSRTAHFSQVPFKRRKQITTTRQISLRSRCDVHFEGTLCMLFMLASETYSFVSSSSLLSHNAAALAWHACAITGPSGHPCSCQRSFLNTTYWTMGSGDDSDAALAVTASLLCCSWQLNIKAFRFT